MGQLYNRVYLIDLRAEFMGRLFRPTWLVRFIWIDFTHYVYGSSLLLGFRFKFSN